MLLILQVIISVVVVYLIFSVIVSVIVEWLAGLLRLRGKMLKHAITDLFNDKDLPLGDLVYKHPQIRKLMHNNEREPSYVPAPNVALSVIDIVKDQLDSKAMQIANVSPEGAPPPAVEPVLDADDLFARYKSGLKNLKSQDLRKLLSTITGNAVNIKEVQSLLETWYNDYMDRVSGWYKRHTRLLVLIVGVIVTMAGNVDTIFIIKASKNDPALRARMNALADKVIQDSSFNAMVEDSRNLNASGDYFDDYVDDSSVHGSADTLDLENQPLYRDSLIAANMADKQKQFKELTGIVRDWELPVGWPLEKKQCLGLSILGWMLTMIALSFGAPFWFDVLKRLVNIRSSGVIPKK